VSPLAGEKFYLRLLLLHVKGATSFEDVRTFNGRVCETFKDACEERALLKDDQEWRHTLTEAAAHQTGDQLLNLFGQILVFCNPSNPNQLWEDFKNHFAENVYHQLKSLYSETQSEEEIKSKAVNMALIKLKEMLQEKSKSLGDYGLPIPDECRVEMVEKYFMRFSSYNKEEQTNIMQRNVENMYPEQRFCFERIMNSIYSEDSQDNLFYVDGIGGAGKTFLYRTILAAVRSRGDLALAVASSGVAALLMPGGQTGHSLFKIPLKVDEYSICSITKQSLHAKMLRKAKVIIWDEAPMMHKNVFEALNRTLMDIVGNDKPFGGITTVFGGDLRQVLPVIPKATPQEIRSSILTRAAFWNKVNVFKLEKNMRLSNLEGDSQKILEKKEFAEFLLAIGDGKIVEDINGDISIPDKYLHKGNLKSLVDYVYQDIDTQHNDASWMSERAILTPKNEEVHAINLMALNKLPGSAVELNGCDSIVEGDDRLYPVELLNSLKPSGMPLNKLILKVGAPIMLLRNLDIKNGLSNGTRLIVTNIGKRVLEAVISIGANAGKRVFIPRIKLTPSDYPIMFERLQFPIQLCFGMSINKCQGQSINKFGIYLPAPVFSHGQLYVAFSRATCPDNVKVLLSNSREKRTKNVVYKSILLQEEL